MVAGAEPRTPQVESRDLPLQIRLDLKEDEDVVFALRQSLLTPLAMLWPVAGGLMGWSILNTMTMAVAGMPEPTLIQFGILTLTTVLALRWLVRDGLGWFVCWYVLTNQRLVVSQGVLRRTRQEASVARIQTTRMERSNPAANALGIGDVQVLTASSTGAIWLRGVARPDDVAYTITLVQQGKLGKRDDDAPDAARSPLDSPAVRAALDQVLEQGDDGDDDEANQSHLLNGGLIRRQIDLALLPGEQVLDRLYRHWFVLLLRLLPPLGIGVVIVLLLAALRTYAGASFTASWTLTAIVALATLVWDLLIVSNYIDDVFILTNQRIIDIDRSYFIFAESRRETLYRSVQDVSINLPMLGRFLSYGHLNVETAGRAPNIEMQNMAHPRRTQERIFALINADKDHRAEADHKSQRKNMRASVGAVLTALMLSTPDVRALPVAAAVTRLRAAGLTVMIAGERASREAPGAVVAQAPSPGATILRGGEVALTLSRRPTSARP